MKVKILRTIGVRDMQTKSEKFPDSPELPGKHDGTPFHEGEVVDVRQEAAEKLFKANLAVSVVEDKK